MTKEMKIIKKHIRMATALLLFLTFSIFLAFSSFAAETLTDNSVLKMVKAGLGEDLIITKIKTSQSQFDLSTDKIIMLKNEKVSDKIIKAMLEASAPPSANSALAATNPTMVSAAPLVNPFPGIPSINSSSLYVEIGGKMSEMSAIMPETQYSMLKHLIPFYHGVGDVWRYISGEKSAIRLTEKQPVFYTKTNPSSFQLVKLAYQQAKNIRYVRSTGGVYKGSIPIKFTSKANGLFEIQPDKDLEPGEYAFVSSPLGSSMYFYDFGIDK